MRRTALDIVLQLVLNGLAVGCIYGLVALGFVLIYKATELVNFAQGDLLMLGAFTCYMFVVWYGVGYWAAFALAIALVGLFGAVLDATVLRRVIGQPQFAVVMLTIGLGAMFRSFASITWGSEIYTLPDAVQRAVHPVGGVNVSHEYLSIIVGTVLLCAGLYAFFTLIAGGRRHAGRLPEPARRVLHGHPREADVLADLGHLGRGGRGGRRPAGARSRSSTSTSASSGSRPSPPPCSGGSARSWGRWSAGSPSA